MRGLTFVLAAALAAAAAQPASAADRATKDEAIAMVKKAVALTKSDGPEKAYAAFDNKKGAYVDRDLYVVVYGLDGKVLAHGANEKLIGQNLIDAKDPDGKMFVKERTEMARAHETSGRTINSWIR